MQFLLWTDLLSSITHVLCHACNLLLLSLLLADNQPNHQGAEGVLANASAQGCSSMQPHSYLYPERYHDVPPVMTDFKKAVQLRASTRPVLPAPSWLPPLPAAAADTSQSMTAEGDLVSTVNSLTLEAGISSSASAASASLTQPTGNVYPKQNRLQMSVEAIPTDVIALYHEAGTEAVQALNTLQTLTAQVFTSEQLMPSFAGGKPHPCTAFPFAMSETAAHDRLHYYLWGDDRGQEQHQISHLSSDSSDATATDSACNRHCQDVCDDQTSASTSGLTACTNAQNAQHKHDSCPLISYKEIRMLAVGVDSSTKLSPYLALGCISPRQVWQHIQERQTQLQQQQEDQKGSAVATRDGCVAACDWMVMHLCIRCAHTQQIDLLVDVQWLYVQWWIWQC